MLRALAFAGPEQVVECGDVGTGGRAALTVECWVRCDVIGEGNRPILSKWSPDGQEWALYVSRDGRLYCAVNDVSGAVAVGYSGPGVIPPGAWRHVAACFDAIGTAHGAPTVRVLVHGADVTALGEAFGNVSGDMGETVRLGGYLADDQLGFVGRIGWARLSSAVRYPHSTYVVPWLPPQVDGATLAQWNVTEGQGLTADNCVGNPAFDGLIDGATWVWGPKVGKRQVEPHTRTTVLQAARRAWHLRVRDRRTA